MGSSTKFQGWAIALLLFALLLFSKGATRSDLLFHSFPKEWQRAIHSFALYLKSDKEQITLSLFLKERQRANCSFALLKRATKSKLLFRSLQKEWKREIHAFALFEKSYEEQFALSLFTKRAKEQTKERIALFLLFCSF